MFGKNTSLQTMQWCGSILCRYKPCSGVAAYYVKSMLVCMQCVVQNETVGEHKHLYQDARCNDKDYKKWSFLNHNFLSHLKKLHTLLPHLLRYLSTLLPNLHGGLHTLSAHVLFNIHMQVTCLCCTSQTHCPYRLNIC